MDWMKELIERFPQLSQLELELNRARNILIECAKKGGKILVCGNGGSASDAEHIVGELMKEFDRKRPVDEETACRLRMQGEETSDLVNLLQGAIPAISLNSHTALMTAIANDVDASMVFAQQVYGYGRSGDVLIALSTSGNSKNVLNAARLAKAKDMSVISISGQNGGKIKELSDAALCMPENRTYKVQELTLPVYHMLCHEIEDAVF